MTRFWDWRTPGRPSHALRYSHTRNSPSSRAVQVLLHQAVHRQGGPPRLRHPPGRHGHHLGPQPAPRIARDAPVVDHCDEGPAFIRAGVIFARPGSPEARLLDDVAWRVQLFQNHESSVASCTTPANRTMPTPTINAALRLLSLGDPRRAHVAHVDGALRGAQPVQQPQNAAGVAAAARGGGAEAGSDGVEEGAQPHRQHPLGVNAGAAGHARDGDQVPVVRSGPNDCSRSRHIFAHLPYDPSNAVTHLTAARSFQARTRAQAHRSMGSLRARAECVDDFVGARWNLGLGEDDRRIVRRQDAEHGARGPRLIQ